MAVQYDNKCMSKGKVCVWVETFREWLTNDNDDDTTEHRVLMSRNWFFSILK